MLRFEFKDPNVFYNKDKNYGLHINNYNKVEFMFLLDGKMCYLSFDDEELDELYTQLERMRFLKKLR